MAGLEVTVGLRDRLRRTFGRPAPAPAVPSAPRAPRPPTVRAPVVPIVVPQRLESTPPPGVREVVLVGGWPDPATIGPGPVVVRAADPLDAAGFAELLAARGAPAVWWAAERAEEAP